MVYCYPDCYPSDTATYGDHYMTLTTNVGKDRILLPSRYSDTYPNLSLNLSRSSPQACEANGRPVRRCREIESSAANEVLLNYNTTLLLIIVKQVKWGG